MSVVYARINCWLLAAVVFVVLFSEGFVIGLGKIFCLQENPGGKKKK